MRLDPPTHQPADHGQQHAPRARRQVATSSGGQRLPPYGGRWRIQFSVPPDSPIRTPTPIPAAIRYYAAYPQCSPSAGLFRTALLWRLPREGGHFGHH
jgi:hypothetical protein